MPVRSCGCLEPLRIRLSKGPCSTWESAWESRSITGVVCDLALSGFGGKCFALKVQSLEQIAELLPNFPFSLMAGDQAAQTLPAGNRERKE